MWLHFVGISLLVFEAVVIFSSRVSGKSKRILYLTLVFLQLFILSAFRSINIGNDTEEYITLFYRVANTNDIFEMLTRYERGYIVLNKVLSHLSSNPQILLIVTSFFILFVFMRFIYKNSNMVWLSVYLFITLGGFFASLNILRQYLAMSIILISYDFLKKRKLIPFITLVLFAALFHSSALIFLLIYPFTYLDFSFKKVIIIMSCAILVFFSFIPFINFLLRGFPQFLHYTSSKYFDGDVRLASIMNTLVMFGIFMFGMVVIFLTKKQRVSLGNAALMRVQTVVKTNEISLLSYIILFGAMIFFISINANLIDRIGAYFSVFNIIFIPQAIGHIKNKNLAILAIFLIMVFTLAYSTVILIYRPGWNHVYPYEFFWQVN